MINTPREFVAEYFNEEQLKLYNYILSSFPEFLVTEDGVDNKDVITVIALIAYVLGSSRDFINNLQISKSVSELLSEVGDTSDELYDNNMTLLVLLAEELKSNLLSNDMSVEEKKAAILVNTESISDSYSLIRNRGSEASIEQVVTAFLDSLNRLNDTYSIDNNISGSPGVTRIILTAIDEYIDKLSFSGYTDGEGNSLYNVKSDNNLYKQLMFIKPAGLVYQILMPYADTLMFNTLEEPVITSEHDADTEVSLGVKLFVADSPSFIGGLQNPDYVNSLYTIEVVNTNNYANLIAQIMDFSDSDYSAYSSDIQGGGFANVDGLDISNMIEIELPAGFKKKITRLADNSNFNLDGAITKVVAYFIEKDTGFLSTLSVLDFTSSVPPTPEPPAPVITLSLISSNLDVSSDEGNYGGYAGLQVYNDNDTDVVANIILNWRDITDSVTTYTVTRAITIPANSWSSFNQFYNPSFELSQIAKFNITLSKEGFNNSPTVVKNSPIVVPAVDTLQGL